MSEEINLIIREATAADATQLTNVMATISEQTEYLALDELGMDLSLDLLQQQLDLLYQSPANVLLLALDDNEIVGTASISSRDEKRIAHIGEVGISILKEYWGFGLGSVLMEELIEWSKKTNIIRRLELSVQKQNKAAIHLYQKFGFHTEAVMKRGALSDQGIFLDCLLMSLMID